MALTRARIVSGSDVLAAKVEAAILDVLTIERDRKKLADDVHDMRDRIDKEKGTDAVWNLKQVRGGLVDLEFIAQFLQVITARENPDVLDQNTSQSLENLASAGVLSHEDALILIPAAGLYHNLTQVLRLCLERPFNPAIASPGLKALLARAAGMPDFEALEEHLTATLATVREAYARIVA
jgi:glutamate-ammonia-ligase adenylyltransferase